jgi:DNA (cytosine-5)-methyltransferase 1
MTLSESNNKPILGNRLKIAGLFAGIGGIEEGFRRAGHHAHLLCDSHPGCQAVLRARFPDVPIHGDIRKLEYLPRVDAVVAGFPCQDLSQAGTCQGIQGSNSRLVDEVFRLLERSRPAPTWVLFENVPFMLRLHRGRAMSHLVTKLEDLGYRWAYRTIDTRAFGLPQRRQRVLLLASKTEEPRDALLADDVGGRQFRPPRHAACGFYWTEGRTGVGWAVNAIPTLKGGSSVSIPSPPAIWMPEPNFVGLPDIRDAERLQGFRAGWSTHADTRAGPGRTSRWKLVGNAFSVPVAQWLGERISTPSTYDETEDAILSDGQPWPIAAWGQRSKRFSSPASLCPRHEPYMGLSSFLRYPLNPLSARATEGFLKRARSSTLRFADGFLEGLEDHLGQMTTVRA